MSNAWGRSRTIAQTGARRADGLEEESRYAGPDSRNQVRLYNYTLSPGRSVGSEEPDEESEPLEELFPELVDKLLTQFSQSRDLQDIIENHLSPDTTEYGSDDNKQLT